MLPRIEQPLFKMTVPSSKKEIMVRPMLVKEEKILLMAKEGDDFSEKLMAIQQVVANCCKDLGDISKLTLFDLEYLFLKIRAISIDNIVKIIYRDEDDEKEREFEIDLSTVEVDFKDEKEDVIPLGKDSGLTLKYPTVSLYKDLKDVSKEEEFMEKLIVHALKTYYVKDEVYDLTKETVPNLIKFVDENLNTATYYKIREYLESMPTLKHEIKYTNDDGKEKTITLSTLNDFFTF